MASEGLGAGFVTILPDPVAFEAALTRMVTASVATVNKQFAAVGSIGAGAAGAGQGVFAGMEAEAAGVAGAINGKLAPALKTAQKGAKDAAKEIDSASTSLGGMQRQIMAVVKIAPLLAAAFSVKVFADFEKAAAEVTTVFGGSSDEIIGFAQNIDSSFRLTQTSALRMSADIGNAIIGTGISAANATKATEEAVQRVADIAAFQGKQVPAISTAFMLAMEGNARGLKQLGVEVSAADIKTEMLREGIKGTAAEMSDAQRTNVFYNLVMADTAKFSGAAAKTTDTFGGKLGEFKKSVGDAALAIGSALAPAVEGVLGAFTSLIDGFSHWNPVIKTSIEALGLLTAAFITFTAVSKISILTNIIAGFATLGETLFLVATAENVAEAASVALLVTIDALGGPLVIVGAALTALAGVFFLTQHHAKAATTEVGLFDDIINKTGKDLDTAALADIARKIADPKIADALKATGISVQDFAKGVTGGAQASLELRTRLRGLWGDPTIPLDQINTVHDALITLQGDFGTASTKSANLSAAAAALGLNLADSAAQIDAQTKAINDLFAVTDQLASAKKTEASANDALAAAQKKVNDLTIVGVGPEIADARIKLGDATDSLTASLLRQAEAQKALDALNAPATDQELADAADKVTLAQIGVRDAIRARDAAERALHKTVGVSVNLAGLDLRQLNTALANARATLAAQRASAAAKTPQQLQDDLATAQIGVNKAVEDQKTAEDELTALKQKGLVKTDEILHQEREVVLAKNAAQKAQEQVNKTQGDLNSILAGNSEFAKQLASAQGTVKDATDKVHDAQKTVSDLVAKQLQDTKEIKGVHDLINQDLITQIGLHAQLFAQDAALRRSLIENQLSAIGATVDHGGGNIGPLVGGDLGQPTIDALFNDLAGNNQAAFIALLKRIGVNIPGHALGGLVTRPEFAFLGEKFKVESVIPWGQGASRVWDVLSQSLPHMPTVVRQRLEPVIPGRPTVSAATHLNRPVAEFDYDALGKAVARALRAEGVGADIDINVTPTPGMSESRLARKLKRELDRYREMP